MPQQVGHLCFHLEEKPSGFTSPSLPGGPSPTLQDVFPVGSTPIRELWRLKKLVMSRDYLFWNPAVYSLRIWAGTSSLYPPLTHLPNPTVFMGATMFCVYVDPKAFPSVWGATLGRSRVLFVSVFQSWPKAHP